MEKSFHYVADAEDQRLDVFLARQSGLSREFAQEQISAGRVLVAGLRCTKASRRLQPGETVTGSFVEAAAPDLAPVAKALSILHEDDDFLVLDKGQGVVVHPAAGHHGDTLVHYLLHHLRQAPGFPELSPTRPGIVHRLDRGTSGVLVVAKHRQAQERLSEQFKRRTVKKDYEAIVWHRMERTLGRFDQPVGRDPKDRKRMKAYAPDRRMTPRMKDGTPWELPRHKVTSIEPRTAVTRWRCLEVFSHFTHVRLFPETGRTHQIRVHLLEGGHPIVGDDLYGVKTQTRRDGLGPRTRAALDGTTQTFLHACRLELDHPMTNARMAFEAPLPPSFSAFLGALREEDR